MYKEFQKEQFDRDTLEITEGFVTYNVYEDRSLYIHVMYVKPSCRGGNIAQKLENTLVEMYNPDVIYCYVDLGSKDPNVSLGCIIGAGYKIDTVEPTKIVLKKVING